MTRFRAGAAAAVTTTGLGLLWLRRRYLVATVTGRSMEPHYRAGMRVLVRRASLTGVRRGQVVVIERDPAEIGRDDPRTGPQLMIKRTAAVPGDPVPRDRFAALREVPEAHVPPGRLVVIGDQPDESYDSRHYGYIPSRRLIGVVVRIMA